ncbi:hypothetical protein [Sphingomonas sp. BK580]|uniref:hypothetical protein n=1 Tax=Sphingomonas sp. BK580 TaxID=2586972 RepID=UPI00161D9C45|nr:hypothetical protein [Sphingomonas sp. BK580]MBB3693533.1 hypothetical protein [Sphingomonas sp. BK580]
MPYITQDRANRLSKKLKNVLRNELGEETPLHQCRKAIIEALDFDTEGHMLSSLPCATTWNRDWYVNHLVDNGYVEKPANAEAAVATLEAIFGDWLLEEESAPLNRSAIERPAASNEQSEKGSTAEGR